MQESEKEVTKAFNASRTITRDGWKISGLFALSYGVIYVAILYLIIYLFHIKNMYSVLRYLLSIKYIHSQ